MAPVSSFSQQLQAWLARWRIPSVLFYYLAINVAIYLLTRFYVTLWGLGLHRDASSALLEFLALPAYIPNLLRHPWTLLTYMFFHEDFTHILFNMLWLWVFGKMFLQHFSPRQFQWGYLLGGFVGALAYIAAYNIFPYFELVLPHALAMGASASIMAITLAAILAAPNQEVYLWGLLRIRVAWIAVGILLIDFLGITQSNAGGHIAHIGGALFGSIFLYITRHNPAHSIRLAWEKFLRDRTQRRQKRKHQRSEQDEQKELDRILKKLAAGGYGALTASEKEKLFRRQR